MSILPIAQEWLVPEAVAPAEAEGGEAAVGAEEEAVAPVLVPEPAPGAAAEAPVQAAAHIQTAALPQRQGAVLQGAAAGLPIYMIQRRSV